MASATLEATTRDSRGKNEARRLRVAGRIPAVLYGGAGGAVPLSVDPKALSRILHSGSGVNSIISLDVQGQGVTQVLVKEFLLEPIKHSHAARRLLPAADGQGDHRHRVDRR